MTRAGREPAEDVKRRLVCACQEAGLTVAHANMCLVREANARVIYVGACFADWPYETPTVSVMAMVPVDGAWPDFVDIRCCATEGDPALVLGPWMKGRDTVPFTELVEHLQATLAEREKVIAAIKSGVEGPFRFERSEWQRVDLLKGPD